MKGALVLSPYVIEETCRHHVFLVTIPRNAFSCQSSEKFAHCKSSF